MIETKILELRDHGTFIPIIALRVRNERSGSQEDWLLGKCGWGPQQEGFYLFSAADDGRHFAISCGDPEYLHMQSFPADRTFTTTFTYVSSHWDEFETGDVVDVRVILGEAQQPVTTDREFESYRPTEETTQCSQSDGT